MKHALFAAVVLLAACKPAAETAPAAGMPSPQTPADPPVAAATPSGASPRYFYFGNHVPRSLITAVEGADTASARLVGLTTAQDGFDYCVGEPAPEDLAEAEARCQGEKVERAESMTADCIARTVSDGSPAVWVRDEPAEDGKVSPVWQDRATGQIRDYSGAGGGYVLTAAFRIMCPAASVNLAPDPS